MSEKLFDFFPWTLPKRDFLQPTSSSSFSSSSSSNVSQTSTSALLQNDYIHQLLLLNQNIVCFDSSCLITSHHSGIFAWNCLLIKILRSILSVFPLDSDVVPAFNVVLVLTNNTRNHFDLLLRKHLLDLSKLEKQSYISVVNLFSNDQDKSDFLEEKTLFSSGSSTDDNTICLTWNEFSAKVRRGEHFLSDQTRQSHMLLMVDDLDEFERIGRSSGSVETPIQLLSHCCGRMNQFDFLVQQRREIPRGNYFVSLISYARLPSEIRIGFQDMNFQTTTLLTCEQQSSRYSNGPLHEQDHSPLLSEYLKARADLQIIVSPLQTGHSAQVHGSIAVHFQSLSQILSHNGRTKQSMHYKATENAVFCYLFDS